MATIATRLDVRMLLLLTLWGFSLTCKVEPATMEDVANLVDGPLWDQTTLTLSGEGLSGPIPPGLGGLTNLTELWLTGNSLSGPIPPELGSLTNLFYLSLWNNSLSGPIPPELGSLTNLNFLSLWNNSLSGPIPPELGSLTNLDYLDLNSNDLSGPIPPELGRLTRLSLLDLSNNNLSGPIPSELGSLTNLNYLYLFSNNLSGPIPPELGSLTDLFLLDLSFNNMSGPIPHELGNLCSIRTLNLSFTDTSCELLDLSCMTKITELGLPCSPPSSFKDTDATYVALTVGAKSKPAKHMDLSSVPNSCKIVNLTGSYPDLESFRFWGACDEGCVVSLAGTGATLSRSTRRKVCLSRISVFLSGDIPFPLYNDRDRQFLGILSNRHGNYTPADPDFVDKIDLGPEGRAYTGVDFSRVQVGNLCGNPEAKAVVGSVFGAAAGLLLLATAIIVVVARWRRRICGHTDGTRRYHILSRAGLYLWGIALGVLPLFDLATDVLVLSEVWGAWPMWVVLASVCAPFAFGAFMLAKTWALTEVPVRGWEGMRMTWSWPLPELGEELRGAGSSGAWHSWLLVVALFPLGLVGVLVQDVLSVAERFGVHLAWGDEILVFEQYQESRVIVELLLESLPQAVFQTGLYMMGSSRATRIYIDQRIFVRSIVVSLCSLSMHSCLMLWEAVYERKTLFVVFMDKFKSAGQPILVKVTPNEDKEEEAGEREIRVWEH